MMLEKLEECPDCGASDRVIFDYDAQKCHGCGWHDFRAPTEYGWLIEAKPSVSRTPVYWGVATDGALGWTGDDKAAIRFARKVDAEAMIKDYGWTEAFAVEHAWVPPSGNRTEGKRTE